MNYHVYWGFGFLLVFINALVLANKPGDGEGRKHFVLVHGIGHGGWCWYKITASLEEVGHTVTPLDLASNGNNKIVADNVTDVAQFVQPLTDFLSNYAGKVILVGHSLGGSAISYAMEAYPDKIEKAVFLAALMPLNGHTFVPTKAVEAGINLILNRALIFNFGNMGLIPTSTSINLELAPAYVYNRSPPEDVYLAYSCLNAIPFRPTFNILSLTEARYGSVPRFYVKTTDDNIIPPEIQESFIRENPPENVFTVPESDHSPFFSQPTALVNILMSIANS